jgi:ATP-binding cassette subfamily F protein 3
MLRIQDITFGIGGRTLFESASAHIPAGHRVGLSGSNGSGKTTLLRLIMKQSELDGGEIRLRAKATVGIVSQDAPTGDATPLEFTLSADEELTRLREESLTATNPLRIAEVHTRLMEIGADSAPARAASILSGLGFSEEDQHRPLKHFSGGWRMRVALSSVLFAAPDLLLLDEPTNHLDLEAAEWLKAYLKEYPHTLLMVSHDRDFLCTTVTSILHLSGTKLEMYTGGYDDFIRVRNERLFHTEAAKVKQEAARKRMQDFVNRFRAKATKARQAQSRIKMLERMTPIADPVYEKKIRFHFPKPLPSSSPLVRLDNAAVGYEEGVPILKDLHFTVFEDDRIALLGRNGNGKTTLARLLFGDLKPQQGEVFRNSKLKVGYFAQDHLDRLDPTRNPIEQLRAMMADASISEVRGWLGRFGLGEDKAEVACAQLSGGEKTRLALCLAARESPNLLILDEPTNHLDIDSRQSLLEALADYQGAVILVSHDRHLLEASADRLWLIDSGTGKEFFGDLDDYVAELKEARRTEKRQSQDKSTGDKAVNKKQLRKEAAEIRQKIAPLKKAAEAAEKQLEAVHTEKDSVDKELADPATYEKDPSLIQSLTKKRNELETASETAEAAWLIAAEALEQACAAAAAAEADGDLS